MLRAFVATALLLLAPIGAAPVSAQRSAQQPDSEGRCQNQQSRRRRGGMFGGIAGSALRRFGAPSSVAGIAIPTDQILSEAVTAMLDCREREQAADATNEAVRGGVGTTATWQSETRPNVSGASTVTGRTAGADGNQCLTVSDLIIVEGQETRVPKTMCRRPPSNRYVRV